MSTQLVCASKQCTNEMKWELLEGWPLVLQLRLKIQDCVLWCHKKSCIMLREGLLCGWTSQNHDLRLFCHLSLIFFPRLKTHIDPNAQKIHAVLTVCVATHNKNLEPRFYAQSAATRSIVGEKKKLMLVSHFKPGHFKILYHRNPQLIYLMPQLTLWTVMWRFC